MLEESSDQQSAIENFLDTFFHPPTLLLVILVHLSIVGWLSEVSLEFGSGFVRLGSRLGEVMLYWLDGCCRVIW